MKKHPPLLTGAEYEVTHRCNFECVHCYLAGCGERDELGFDDVLRLMDELADAGVLHLAFTGGEPFVREDFLDILAAAREHRFAPVVLTNGSLLDEAAAETLARLKLHRLIISLPGVTEETFGAVTRRPEMFGQLIENIERCARLKIPLELHVTLLAENIAELDGFGKFAERLHLPLRLTPRLSPRVDGSPAPLEHEIPDESLAAFAGESFVSCARPDTGGALCPVGTGMLAVSPGGTLLPCLQWREPLGRVPGDLVKDVWRDSPVLERLRSLSRSDYPGCASCELFDRCRLCPGVSTALGEKETADPVACRQTHLLAGLGLL